MLEDHRQHHYRRAPVEMHQQVAGADPVLGLALQHRLHRVLARLRFPDIHRQPGLPVVVLHLGGVVAGELELVAPAQLQRHILQGLGRRGRQDEEQKRQTGGKMPA